MHRFAHVHSVIGWSLDWPALLVRCCIFIATLLSSQAPAAATIYVTETCKHFLNAEPSSIVAGLAQLVADKGEALAPQAKDGAVIFRSQTLASDLTGGDVWIVTRPSGTVASCSGFWFSTRSANPEPEFAVTNGAKDWTMDSDSPTTNLEATAFEGYDRCGTGCGYDALTIVVTGVSPIREFFISHIESDVYIETRPCPTHFQFELQEVRLFEGKVHLAGFITATTYCEWDGRVCSLFLPPSEVHSEALPVKDGITIIDTEDFPIFRDFLKVQDDLHRDVCGVTKPCDDDESRYSRCVSTRSTQSFLPK